MKNNEPRCEKPQFVDSSILIFVLFFGLLFSAFTASVIAHGIIGVDSSCANKPPGQMHLECMHILQIAIFAVCYFLYSFIGLGIIEYVNGKVVE